MMSGAKFDVTWSPVHPDKFVLWGSDITLYEVSPCKDVEQNSTCLRISSSSIATPIATQSAGGVRCIDVSSISGQPEPLLALGHTSGRVSLTSLGLNVDPLGLVGREFGARYSRLCNAVAWSSTEPELLAAALDKHRSDHSVLLWDVHRSSAPAAAPATEGAGVAGGAGRPLAEVGLSETAHGVAWTRDRRTLLASMNMRFIKIFDLRDLSNKAVSVATSRYCYGACADPFNPWQVASRGGGAGEAAVCVWDTRAFEHPLLTLPQPRTLLKIMWCPSRRNLLCSLQRDASTLRLHDIQQAHLAEPEPPPDLEQVVQSSSAGGAAPAVGVEAGGAAGGAARGAGGGALERDVSPVPLPLAGFSWHPFEPARVLAVTLSGMVVDYTVQERGTVAWGAGGALARAAGPSALAVGPAAPPRDLASRLRARADTDYGLKPELWQNAELAEDEALSSLWHFLALSRSLVEDGCIRNSPSKHPGVLSLFAEGGAYRSESVPSLLADLPQRRVTLYRSAERSCALQLCGWGWGWEQAGAGVERAEAEGTPARAAALAAFHLRLRTALDVLQRAKQPPLALAALALAGLSEERLWREALPGALAAMPDPYLRAVAHFLAGAAPAAAPPAPTDMRAVLEETEMRLEDRVAFACMFLPDARLAEYLRSTARELADTGQLAGLLLTGMSPEGVALLQRWVERTGDVQSAALLAARCLPPDLLGHTSVLHWIDSYRALLASWRLWWARCSLDTALSAAGAPPPEAAQQVVVSCGYCGKGVSAPGAGGRTRAPAPRLPPPAAKHKPISVCPHCRKPLGRCAVCSLHVGSGAGGGAGGAGASFAGWLVWCVACRHGGHAAHLLHWFKQHAECPVSSCSCRCSSLDRADDDTE